MSFSRRNFLQKGVLTAVAACTASPLFALGGRRAIDGEEQPSPLHPSPSKSGNWQDHVAALDGISRAAFTAAIGTNFKVFLADNSEAWVTLMAVEDLPRLAPVNPASFAVANKHSSFAPTSTGFVLVFGGSTPLPEQTHLFEHGTLGRFALFTVPASTPQVYSGVINRLDGGFMVAAPYAKTQSSAGNTANTVVKAGSAITAAPATSAADETLSQNLSETRGARRTAQRD